MARRPAVGVRLGAGEILTLDPADRAAPASVVMTVSSFPFCIAQMAASECQWLQVAMETASMFGSSTMRRRSWT